MKKNGRLSIYITVTNALTRRYPFCESISSALGVADEVVVVDGGSTDGTKEELDNINCIAEISQDMKGKLKIYENYWDNSKRNEMLAIQKTFALQKCTMPWCMLLDADEVIHEGTYSAITDIILGEYPKNILGFICNTLHFYKDYKHINMAPKFYRNKVYIVRNGVGIKHGRFGDDPDNHITTNGEEVRAHSLKTNIPIFHYGWVNDYETVNEKFNRMESWWHKDWSNKSFEWDMSRCRVYKGTHPAYMKYRIKAFGG